MTLLQRIRQHFCSHEVTWTDVRRVSPGLVLCPCLRCGKVLSASHGVALDAKWRRPTTAQLQQFYDRPNKDEDKS